MDRGKIRCAGAGCQIFQQTQLTDKIHQWRKSLESFKCVIPNQFWPNNKCDSPRELEIKVRFSTAIPAVRVANPTELLRSIIQEKKSNYIKKSSSSSTYYIKIEILEKENSVMFLMPNLIKYIAIVE